MHFLPMRTSHRRPLGDSARHSYSLPKLGPHGKGGGRVLAQLQSNRCRKVHHRLIGSVAYRRPEGGAGAPRRPRDSTARAGVWSPLFGDGSGANVPVSSGTVSHLDTTQNHLVPKAGFGHEGFTEPRKSSKMRPFTVAEWGVAEWARGVAVLDKDRAKDGDPQGDSCWVNADPLHLSLGAGIHSGRMLWFCRKKLSGS
jgi:hypothetical protein